MAYFGSYLHLRLNHTFIHRAGGYAPGMDGRRPDKATNHFIEPAEVADGPAIFASVMFVAAATSESNDFNQAEIDELLAVACEEVQKEQQKTERLFGFFQPAAFLETLVWKVIDPSPLARMYNYAEPER